MKKSPQKPKNNQSDLVSFTTKIDLANATKDGFYLNGYVVNIEYEEAKKLNGKKVKITGKVTVVKGIKNESPDQPISQGRSEDTKHIKSPKIEIIKE
jgi:hypothetical protein